MPLTLSPPAGVATVTGPAPTLSTSFRLRPPSGVVVVSAPRPALSMGGSVVTPVGTGAPSYPFTLFRGQAIGVKMSRQRDLLRLVIDCEDYNRLPPLLKVGAPAFGISIHQPDPPPDGTDIQIDGNAQTAGSSSSPALFVLKFNAYWVGPSVDTSTHVAAISGAGSLPDFSTASTDFKAFADVLAAHMGPYVRWWIDPDLKLWLTELAPVGTIGRFAVTAPYSLDEDGPLVDGIIRPMSLTADWDFSKIRRRVFIHGGTPESTLWVTNLGSVPPYAGEEYHDAPGSVTAADATAVGLFQFASVFRRVLSGTTHIESGHDGWRPGETLYVTSSRLSTPGRELAATPTIIQSVSGHLVAPGPGLTFKLNGVTLDNVTWQSFTFANGITGPEKCTITVEIVDVAQTLAVNELDDVQVITDGNAKIEYDLAYGDVDVGDLAKALAQYVPPATTPTTAAYQFAVTVDDPDMPAPSSGFNVTLVTAQLIDDAKKPVKLAGVIVEWVLLQWTDDALTIPGDTYQLADATGITDATGRVFTDLARGPDDAATSIAYKITPLALPV